MTDIPGSVTGGNGGKGQSFDMLMKAAFCAIERRELEERRRREDMARQEQERREAEMRQGLDELNDMLSRMARQQNPLPEPLPEPEPEFDDDDVMGRLDAILDRLDALSDGQKRLEARLDTVEQSMREMAERLDRVEQSMAAGGQVNSCADAPDGHASIHGAVDAMARPACRDAAGDTHTEWFM